MKSGYFDADGPGDCADRLIAAVEELRKKHDDAITKIAELEREIEQQQALLDSYKYRDE
jgi:hypothetical protein